MSGEGAVWGGCDVTFEVYFKLPSCGLLTERLGENQSITMWRSFFSSPQFLGGRKLGMVISDPRQVNGRPVDNMNYIPVLACNYCSISPSAQSSLSLVTFLVGRPEEKRQN